MPTIKVTEETHKRLIEIRGEMEQNKRRIISMNNVIQAILDEREKLSS